MAPVTTTHYYNRCVSLPFFNICDVAETGSGYVRILDGISLHRLCHHCPCAYKLSGTGQLPFPFKTRIKNHSKRAPFIPHNLLPYIAEPRSTVHQWRTLILLFPDNALTLYTYLQFNRIFLSLSHNACLLLTLVQICLIRLVRKHFTLRTTVPPEPLFQLIILHKAIIKFVPTSNCPRRAVLAALLFNFKGKQDVQRDPVVDRVVKVYMLVTCVLK